MVHFHLDLAPQMLAYHESICSFQRVYPFTAWYRYDVAFRLNIVRDKSARWDKLYDYAFDRFLRTQPTQSYGQPTCFRCSQPGNYSSNCPNESFRPKTSTSEPFPPKQVQMSPFDPRQAPFHTRTPYIPIAGNSMQVTAATLSTALTVMPATSAEAIIQERIAKHTLLTNFEPLPSSIYTPVKVSEFKRELIHHPDKQFVAFIYLVLLMVLS